MTLAQVRQVALRLLTGREYGVKALQDKLLNKGCPEDAVTSVIASLCAEGILSDQRFMEGYIRHRMRQGYGPFMIRQHLRSLCDDMALWEPILSELQIDWAEVAYDFLVQRKASFIQSAEQVKIMGYLQRRGFSAQVIRVVMQRLPHRHQLTKDVL